MSSSSEIDILSQPLESHPDTQGTFWHQGEMHKVLLYLQCKAVWRQFQMTECVFSKGVEVWVSVEGHPGDKQASPVIS